MSREGQLPGLGSACGYALVTFPVRFLPFSSSASLGESISSSRQQERWSPVGVFWCGAAPPVPLARTGRLQGAGAVLFDPCLGFQAVHLLLPN